MTNDRNRRMDKFEKRRRNNKFINYSLVIASVLVVFLIGVWIFGGGNDKASENANNNESETDSFFHEVEEDNESEEESEPTFSETEEQDDENKEEEEDESNEEDEETEVETEVVDSDDPNVIEAVTGNWSPIGTEQTGSHDETVFDDGSQDRIEIKQAVSMVTGIPEESIIEHWIGNGGSPEKVIATVSDQSLTETYRVYLDWINEEGWQPTRMEKLKDYDA